MIQDLCIHCLVYRDLHGSLKARNIGSNGQAKVISMSQIILSALSSISYRTATHVYNKCTQLKQINMQIVCKG